MNSKSFSSDLIEKEFNNSSKLIKRNSNRSLTADDYFIPKNFVPTLKPKEKIFIEEEDNIFSLHFSFYNEKETEDSISKTDNYSSDEENQFIINISQKKSEKKTNKIHPILGKLEKKKI